MLSKEEKEIFGIFEGKNANINIKNKNIQYEAYGIEIIGQYLRFKDKYGRLTLVDITRISDIKQIEEKE